MSPRQTAFYKKEHEKEEFDPRAAPLKLLEEDILLERVREKPVSTYSVNTRQACNIIHREIPPVDQLVKQLPEYSIKFHNILNKIFQSKGKVLVYSNFVESTLNVFASILKHLKISYTLDR